MFWFWITATTPYAKCFGSADVAAKIPKWRRWGKNWISLRGGNVMKEFLK
jgi:hypothetical protein